MDNIRIFFSDKDIKSTKQTMIILRDLKIKQPMYCLHPRLQIAPGIPRIQSNYLKIQQRLTE